MRELEVRAARGIFFEAHPHQRPILLAGTRARPREAERNIVDDLEVVAVDVRWGAARDFHHDAVSAERAQIDGGFAHLETLFGEEPLADELWMRPRAEHLLPGGGKLSRELNRGTFFAFVGDDHGIPSSSACKPDKHMFQPPSCAARSGSLSKTPWLSRSNAPSPSSSKRTSTSVMYSPP